MRKIRAGDEERLSALCLECLAEDGDEFVKPHALAIIGDESGVRIRDQRCDDRDATKQVLNPWNLQLDRMLRQVVKDVLEEFLSGFRPKSRNNRSVDRHTTER